MLAGTAGDATNRAVAKQLLTPPDWLQLAKPLITAVQIIILDPEDAKTNAGLLNNLDVRATTSVFMPSDVWCPEQH